MRWLFSGRFLWRNAAAAVVINNGVAYERKNTQDEQTLEVHGSVKSPLQRLSSLLEDKWIRKFTVCASQIPSTSKCGDYPIPVRNLLKLCRQEHIVSWEDAFSKKRLDSVYKVNEGSFGEVYAIRSEDGREYHVIKIVPVDGDVEINGFEQMTSDGILPELVASRLLSNLPEGEKNRTKCFIQLHDAYLIRGKYHPAFVKAWLDYDAREESSNGNPAQLPPEQLYLIFEYEYGGESIDNFRFHSAHQAVSVLCQSALALSAAEKAHEFEHRDMHIGNILVFTKPKHKQHEAVVAGRPFSFCDHSISVRLIDFTMARFVYKDRVFFYDFSEDDAVFEGDGTELHHDVYRQMRAYTRNEWRGFHPVTNVLWLEYLLEALLDLERYDHPIKEVFNVLELLLVRARKCRSATEFVSSRDFAHVLEFLNQSG